MNPQPASSQEIERKQGWEEGGREGGMRRVVMGTHVTRRRGGLPLQKGGCQVQLQNEARTCLLEMLTAN